MKRRRTADDFMFMRDMAAKRLAEPFCQIVDSLWRDKQVNNDGPGRGQAFARSNRHRAH
jgi:hypothetical protein